MEYNSHTYRCQFPPTFSLKSWHLTGIKEKTTYTCREEKLRWSFLGRGLTVAGERKKPFKVLNFERLCELWWAQLGSNQRPPDYE